MSVIRTTRSLCPVCLSQIPADLVSRDEKMYMVKNCPEHGHFEDLYYGDASLYNRLMADFTSGSGIKQPLAEYHGKCAQNCGLCNNHKSSPGIGIIDVTNRCNLDCTVCFAGCNSSRSMYEPPIETISAMMDTLLNCDPPCPIVLFSGGEPTMRHDFLDICRMAKQKGFKFIIVATNGKKLAADPDYHRQLAEAEVDIVYLQFDGVTPEPYIALRGIDLLPLKLQALENMANSPVDYPVTVLVPTVAKGINDHQIGEIVRFASKNIKNVKGVLFQPIGFVGHIKNKDILAKRITNAEGIKSLSESFNNTISMDDFYSVIWIRDFIEAFKRIHKRDDIIELSIHPACFAVSYFIKHNDDLISLNRLINLPELRNFVNHLKTGSKTEIASELLRSLPKLIRKDSYKMSSKLIKILSEIFLEGSEKAIINFHEDNVLLVGFEHTSDPNNYDCEKVERCCIHYSTPDGKIIPFCSYNLFHRQKTENAFAKKGHHLN